MDGDQLTLEQAIGLLAMPRTVGIHPETKEPIQVGIGRFGPYVRMGSVFGSLDRDDDVLAVGLNRAVDLIAKKMASVRTLGTHPKDKEFVAVRKGRFGPYVQHGQTVANLPRGTMMDDVTLDEAVALLVEKGKTLKARVGAKKARGARAGAKAAAGTAPAPAKPRAAPRTQAARPAAKAAPKKAAAKKKVGAKKAKSRAAR
jgi:DNA topoisomerase-1